MKLYIPYTNKRYIIDANAIIYDTQENKVISSLEQKIDIQFDFTDIPISATKSFLLLLAFKPLFKLGKNILNWEVGYADNNENNISLGNLYWLIPKNKQECPERKGWFVPAGYSKYAVNDQGDVYSRISGIDIKKHLDNDGYYRTTSTNLDSNLNFKQTRARVCRLIALAFHRPFTDPFLIEVNHKDSNRTNDRPENLEWCTSRQNQMHAINHGFATVTNVIIKDLIDNRMYFLNTIIAASRFVQKYPAYLKWYLDNNIKMPINDRYEIVASGNLDDYKEEVIYKVYDEDCVAYNIQTEKTIICSNPQELVNYTGLDRETIRNKLFHINPWPIKNWCFMWCDVYANGKKFRKFTNAEKAFFLDKSGIKNPVRITNLQTNEIHYSESSLNASKILKIPHTKLCLKYGIPLVSKADGQLYRVDKLV